VNPGSVSLGKADALLRLAIDRETKTRAGTNASTTESRCPAALAGNTRRSAHFGKPPAKRSTDYASVERKWGLRQVQRKPAKKAKTKRR